MRYTSHHAVNHEYIRVDKYHRRTRDIKVMIESGIVQKAKVFDAKGSGYVLHFECLGYDIEVKLLHAKLKAMRIFNTLDTAVRFCRQIGITGGIEVMV